MWYNGKQNIIKKRVTIMVKNKFGNPQQYAMQLSEIVQKTEEIGTNVAPFFAKLEEAMQADKLAEMPKNDFQEIAAEFDETVEAYEETITRMKQLKAPVRVMGMHQNMMTTYREYVDATRQMAESLDVTKQVIVQPAFGESEVAQEDLMDKFTAQINRILTSVL